MTDAATDWYSWHADYDELTSAVTQRLSEVQELLRSTLDELTERGPVKVLSLAAGQSRDLLPLVIEHPRRDAIRARTVELDPRNVDFAEGAGHSAGLDTIEYVTGDAGVVDAFADFAPADVILAGELFGLLADADVAGTIAGLGQLCAAGATVIWSAEVAADTAERWLARFSDAGFDVRDRRVSDRSEVLRLQLVGPPSPLVAGTRLFRLD